MALKQMISLIITRNRDDKKVMQTYNYKIYLKAGYTSMQFFFVISIINIICRKNFKAIRCYNNLEYFNKYYDLCYEYIFSAGA